MKPLPKKRGAHGKSPSYMENNMLSILKYCEKNLIRIIVYEREDGYLIHACLLENKKSETYYQWGSSLRMDKSVVKKIKEELC